jgi:hypothetical protein
VKRPFIDSGIENDIFFTLKRKPYHTNAWAFLQSATIVAEA